MKRSIKLLSIFLISGMLFYSGCKNDNEVKPTDQSILPENFSVDIPASISSNSNAGMRTEVDTLNGNAIYINLTTFIAVGKGGATLVQQLIDAIRTYNINKPMTLSIQSNDDNRTKNIVVVANSEFENSQWEFQMTVTDAESEGNPDGGKGLEIFWNRNPVKGIAIIKPYNINRNDDWGSDSAVVRIDYSEAGENGYDKQMIVSIAGLPMPSPLVNMYAISKLKMFAGRTGNIVDLYGNSDHPNAVFFSGRKGFNWAFVGSVLDSADIGVAEVGLPPSGLDATSHSVLLGDYSIKNVFTNEIKTVWPNIPQADLDAYLYNTSAPGFFNNHGFVSAGTAPGPDYDPIVPRLDNLTPYNPKDISNMTISFK